MCFCRAFFPLHNHSTRSERATERVCVCVCVCVRAHENDTHPFVVHFMFFDRKIIIARITAFCRLKRKYLHFVHTDLHVLHCGMYERTYSDMFGPRSNDQFRRKNIFSYLNTRFTLFIRHLWSFSLFFLWPPSQWCTHIFFGSMLGKWLWQVNGGQSTAAHV